MMRRREFITLLGGAAAAGPLAARAQQGDRVRRIGVLMPGDENDPVAKAYVSAFTQALADLGWTVGRNVRMDLRSAGTDINRIRALAQELVGSQPDIILTGTFAATAALQRETRTIPIIFVVGADPVASGNRPAGVPEATGRPAGLDLRLPRRQDQRSCAMHPVVTVTGGSEDGRGLPRAGHPRIGLRAKIGQSRAAWGNTSAQLPVGALTLREGLGSIK